MSGFVGVVNFDGEPLDASLLSRMVARLAFRGPDAQNTWAEGAAGLGHTLLRTSMESSRERQPLTLDGTTWIVADARVDARLDLVDRLRELGHRVDSDAPDVELILHAYHEWGELCVEHLLGDFAFGIWDTARRRLFCARDHLGVKPLFFAHVGSTVVFSNTLECVRLHPRVSEALDDLAVADFLIFNLSQEKDRSFFADVRRLSPAHAATWTKESERFRPYWRLPIDEPLYLPRVDAYVERFRELLEAAVHDRLRTDHVSVFMSGGLDSAAIVSTAARLLGGRGARPGLRGFTTSYDGYDEERHYAGLVAEAFGVPLDVQGWADEMAPPAWSATTFRTPEPEPYPNAIAHLRAVHARVAASGRVALHGEGPDNALIYEWQAYLAHLIRKRRLGRVVRDIGASVWLHRRVPLLTTLPRMIRFRSRTWPEQAFPDWLNPDLERRLDLRQRWALLTAPRTSPHPVRPAAYSSFSRRVWQAHFDGFDAANTGSPLEVRHPYLDLRLLRYMLAVPAIPWCRAKYLIRRSMRGILPPAVIRRPKAPLVGDPWPGRVRDQGLPPLEPAPGLDMYVDLKMIQNGVHREPGRFWVDFRVWSLNYWLQNRSR